MDDDTAIRDCQEEAHSAPEWLNKLRTLVGPEWVYADFTHRLGYARDRAPYATFQVRSGTLPARLPAAVVQPQTPAEVAAVVRFANAEGLRIIPFGAGSGVLCGTVPLNGELIIDLKRLNHVVEVAEEDGLVTVQAGKNGGRLEEELQARGFTVGHLPQSLHMSTVGGWAACRGAGQASTFYGKIEDIVVGLRAVLPDGREVAVRSVPRRAVGPSIKDLLIGSEGTLGILTEVTLRMWRLPEERRGVVLAFPELDGALRAMRRIMQSGLRPAVVRVYDAVESRSRTEGLTAYATRPILGILEFSGLRTMVDAEEAAALAIVAGEGGVVADDAPYHHWQQSRYLSYSPQWQSQGYYMDTIEISAPWSQLMPMYVRMRDQVLSAAPGTHFGTHWSHVYPEGACQYMTIRLPPMKKRQALTLHRQVWDAVQTTCSELGGSISHHHGVGAFRNPWMANELGTGLELLQSIKDALDPGNLMNPGKLGLRPAVDGVSINDREGAR
jgi:alkyldihydroxyacetonephosphate synthase